MSSSDIGAVSGGSRSPETVLVWDLAIRVFHWTLVASILAAYLTSDGLGKVHRLAGYTAVSLLVFRIVWGFAGTRHARFADFVRSPRSILAYIRDILRGDAARSLGHNPAGGAMILALLAIVAGIGTTGLMMESTRFFGSDLVETVHKSLVYSLFVLVPLHVLGVVLASRSHRENLAASMITGRKPLMGTPGEEEALKRELDTRLRATNGLALAAIVTVLVVLGWPQVRAQLDVLEKRRAVAEAAATKTQTKPATEATASAVETTSATGTATAPLAAPVGAPKDTAKSEAPSPTLTSAPVSGATGAAALEPAATIAVAATPDSARDAAEQTDLGSALAAVTQHTVQEIASAAHPRPDLEVAMLSTSVSSAIPEEPRPITARPQAAGRSKAKSAPATRRAAIARKSSKSAAPAAQQARTAKRTASTSRRPAVAVTRNSSTPAAKKHPGPRATAALQNKKSGQGRGRGRSGSSGKGRGGSGHGAGNSGHGSGSSGKGSSGSSGSGSGGSSGSGSGGSSGSGSGGSGSSGGGSGSGSGGGGSSGSGGGHGSSGGGGD